MENLEGQVVMEAAEVVKEEHKVKPKVKKEEKAEDVKQR